MKRVKPRAQTSQEGPVHLAPLDGRALSLFPNLVSHCAVIRYEDGTARQAGWFTLKTQGTQWVISIKDPDAACQLTAIAGTLDDALALADLLLGSDDAPWEPDRFLGQRQGSTKKKS